MSTYLLDEAFCILPDGVVVGLGLVQGHAYLLDELSAVAVHGTIAFCDRLIINYK